MIEKLLWFIIVFSPLVRASWDLWAFTFIHLVSIVILIIWLVKLNIKKYALPKTPLDIPILFLLIFGLISFFYSVNRYNSRNEFFNLVNYIFIYYVIVNFIRTYKQTKTLLYVLFSTATVVAIIGLYQRFMGVKEIYSTMVNPNILAGYLVIIIPLVISCVIEKLSAPDRRRYLFSVLCFLFSGLLMFSCLIFTNSLGGLVSLYIGVSIIFIFYFRYKRQNIRAKPLLFMVVLIIGIFIFLLTIYKFNDPEVSNRILWWEGALKMILDRPLQGVGIGCFQDVYLKYKTKGLNSLYAHNYFLQIGAEMGLFGLGTFIWMLVIFFKRLIVKLKYNLSSFLCIGGLASIWAILIFNLIDYNLYIPANAIIFWIILGICMSEEKPDIIINKYSVKWLLNVVLLLFIILGGIVVTRPFLASQRLEWGVNSLNDGKIDDAENLLYSSIRLDSLNSVAYKSLSDLYNKKGDIDKSIEKLKKALDLTPENAFFHYKLGLLYKQKGQDRLAIDEFKKATGLHYQKIIYHLALADIYEKQGLKELANNEYEIIKGIKNENPSVDYEGSKDDKTY